MRRPKKNEALANKPISSGLPFSGLFFQSGEGLGIVCDRDDLPLTNNVAGHLNGKAVGAAIDGAECNLEGRPWANHLEKFGASKALAWFIKCGRNIVENADAGQNRVPRKVPIKCRMIYRNIYRNHLVSRLLKSLSNED